VAQRLAETLDWTYLSVNTGRLRPTAVHLISLLVQAYWTRAARS
jgi:hypothetical protein